MSKKFAIEAEFTAKDRLSPAVQRMQQTVERFSRRTKSSFDKVHVSSRSLFKGLAIAKAAQMGVRAVGAGLTSVAGAVKDTIQIGAQYEKSLDTVAAKMGGIKRSSEAYKTLGVVSRKIGRDTEFSAVQAAEGLEYLAMAGFGAKQAVVGLPKVVDLATVGSIGFARATDISSDTLGAFNLMSKRTPVLMKNLARVNDVMAKTVTSSNTTLELLFETFKEAGPIGTSFGASLETVASMAGKLADAGIKGSVAGTTLKNVFVNLASPAKKGAKALARIGVAVADKTGKMRDIVDIFGDMQKRLNKLSDKRKMQVIHAIFGKIPLAGVNVLLKTGAKSLDIFRKKLEKSKGSAAAMAAQIRGNTAGSFAALSSKLADLKLTFFQALLPVLQKIIPHMANIITKTATWAEANKGLIAENLISGLQTIGKILSWIGTALDYIRRTAKAAGEYMAKVVIGGQKAWDWTKKMVDPMGNLEIQLKQRDMEIAQKKYEQQANLQQSKNVMLFLQKQLHQATFASPTIAKPVAERMITSSIITKTQQSTTEKHRVEVEVKVPPGTAVKRKSKPSGGFNLRTGRTRALAPIETP